MARRGQQENRKTKLFPLIEPNAAGIDIGATEIYVAAPDDRDPQPVRKLETFTEDLHAAAKWLKNCGITSVKLREMVLFFWLVCLGQKRARLILWPAFGKWVPIPD